MNEFIDFVLPTIAFVFVIISFIRILNLESKSNDANDNKPNISNILQTEEDSYQEIYHINYDEARDADNSKIEIERNMHPYFDALIRHTSQTKESLYIVDYPEHGKPMEEDEPFFHALQGNLIKYFKSIEDLVEKGQITYIRVLQLPLGTNDSEMSDEDKIVYAINMLNNLTKSHIIRMAEFANFKLYIIRKAITNYSQALIDGRKLLVELDRYDLVSRARPNRLSISVAGVESSSRIARVIKEEYDFVKYVLSTHSSVRKEQIIAAILDNPDPSTPDKSPEETKQEH